MLNWVLKNFFEFFKSSFFLRERLPTTASGTIPLKQLQIIMEFRILLSNSVFKQLQSAEVYIFFLVSNSFAKS